MRKLSFFELFYGIMLVMFTAVLTSCVDDNDDTEAPFLKVSSTSLTFGTDGNPVEGSQSSFEISTNRHWTATVKDDKSWVTLSQTEGDGSATIEVSIPENINDEASVVIQVSNKVGALMSETITIKSGSIVESTIIYNETVGTGSLSSPYPYVDAYTEWNKSGIGVTDVTYSGQSASVRKSGLSNNGAYDNASGPNVIFFGTLPASFTINKIALTSAQTNLKLTFGASYSYKPDGATDYDNTFDISKFTVSLSSDGTNWVPLTYTKNNGDQEHPYWVVGTTNFTLKEATTNLYIKFAALAPSAFRLDDITLATGNGGEVIDLGATTGPVEATAITIPELNQMMNTTQTPVDATADRYFEAIVQNDITGGNYSNNNLILATENATAAGNGITLYGSQVDPGTLSLNKGDKVKVTLYKGLAQVKNYNGMFEVTGGKTDTWVKVEKVGTGTITPVVITADKLMDYQGMAVTIQNATIATGGIWASATAISSHTFTAGSTNFTVFCNKGAAAFVDKSFQAGTGSVSGLASVYSDKGQLVPRNLDDVSAFNSTTPMITAVSPTSLNFPATGGTKTIEVSLANQGSNTLSTSGLSGTLSSSVSGTTVTVVATANSGVAINQTLTISLQNGNSVTVAIKQDAAGGSTGNSFTMTSQNIVDGKTGTVELATNSYGSQTTSDVATWYTWSSNSLNFTGTKICIAPENKGSGIQVQGNTTTTKQGRIANVSAISNIQSITIVLKVAASSTYDPSYHVYAGTSANPSSADATISASSSNETVGDFRVYTETYDLSGGNYSYFNIMNDLRGAIYIDSIKVTTKN
ncbi:DUF5689 domain-containing protein [uncultured Bacteroides sp.]|uniref:DUF5689 domain-containing protein n=1 Tax=uncultured Bacteroides sp. TaxID=162156 RepID=UPI002AABBE7A|nr:DUF5689 domain-containing protein [uncultured Bacteroides sp.]